MPDLKDTPLFDLVFQEIAKSPDGTVPFSDYMELALYHPEHGYYADPGRRAIGRRGDFFTSVSVGEVFGLLLARRILAEWEAHFEPDGPFVVVEQGGHDGRLAGDILDALEESGSPLLERLEYRLLEPRPGPRRWLEKALAGRGRTRVAASVEEARAPRGVFLCNELVDAFPFRCLVREGGAWRERRVGSDGRGGLAWAVRPLPPELAPRAEELGEDLPEGWLAEFRPGVGAWMRETSGLFEQGIWRVIDYGFESAEFREPARGGGTLRCYRGHRAGDDPFDAPGETDITAHVDFTQLAREAAAAGLQPAGLSDQHRFLTETAREWLLSMEGRAPGPVQAKRLRQFRTLTDPGGMGRQFRVAEFRRGL